MTGSMSCFCESHCLPNVSMPIAKFSEENIDCVRIVLLRGPGPLQPRYLCTPGSVIYETWAGDMPEDSYDRRSRILLFCSRS